MKKMKLTTVVRMVLLLMISSASAVPVSAQTVSSDNTGNYYLYLILGLLGIIFFQAVVIRKLISLVSEQNYKLMHGAEMPAEPVRQSSLQAENLFIKFWKSLTRSVPKGLQKDTMLDHNYDGIQELDNRMPPWLQYIFFSTVVFALVYLMIYHVYGIGKLPKQEYTEELKRADEEKTARLKSNASIIDETNVKQLNDVADLNAGKIIFIARCSPCHGQNGEGNVGPNLTDEYWLHGGMIGDVFKTVKYGVPVKGMLAWQGILKPDEMERVASYVISLQGSNPSNAKAPQGELLLPQAAISDTIHSKTDSIKIKS